MQTSLQATSRRMSSLLEKQFLKLPMVVWFLLIYFVLQALLYSLLRNGASYDGAEQLITSQALELGYGRSQPPLYTWLLVLFQSFMPGLLSAEHALKATLFIIGYGVIYASGRAIGLSRPAAALAVGATFLLPEIGWQSQTAYTHSTLIFATCSLLLLVFLKLDEKSSLFQHILFGALAGLSLLSKFSAAFLIAAMFATFLYEGRLRAIFGRRQALAGLLAFVLIILPHLIWSANHLEQLFALSERFEFNAYSNPIIARLVGLGNYLASVVIFSGTLGLVSALFIGWRGFRRPHLQAGETRLIILQIAAVLIMALVPILSGAADFAPRWPLAALFPLGLVAAILVNRLRQEQIGLFVALCLIVAMAYMIGTNLRSMKSQSRMQYDYALLLAEIEQATGKVDVAAITDYPVLANLRLVRPSLHLVMQEFPFTQAFLPDPKQPQDAQPRLVYLWTGKGDAPATILAMMALEGRQVSEMKQASFAVHDVKGQLTNANVQAAW